MTCNWTELNQDVASLILCKLPLPDCIRFGAVCTQWNLLFNSCKQTNRQHPSMTAPWAVLSKKNLKFQGLFYNKYEDKIYDMEFLKATNVGRNDNGYICIGAGSNGWLITVHDDDLSVRLLQPLTRKILYLPSLTTLPFLRSTRNDAGRIELFYRLNDEVVLIHNIKKAVLHITTSSSSTSSENEFSVMMLDEHRTTLLFASVGDESWTVLNAEQKLIDLIVYHGKFHTVDVLGSVQVWESDGVSFKPMLVASLSDNSNSYRGFKKDYLEFFHNDMGDHKLMVKRIYLVESADGDQLMMVLDVSNKFTHRPDFKVLLWDKERLKWKLLKNLGGQVLFLACYNSICLYVSDVPGLRESLIHDAGRIDRLRCCKDPNFAKIRLLDPNYSPFIYPLVWFTPRIC